MMAGTTSADSTDLRRNLICAVLLFWLLQAVLGETKYVAPYTPVAADVMIWSFCLFIVHCRCALTDHFKSVFEVLTLASVHQLAPPTTTLSGPLCFILSMLYLLCIRVWKCVITRQLPGVNVNMCNLSSSCRYHSVQFSANKKCSYSLCVQMNVYQ